MKISIIIVNWNTKDLVLACVKSIYKNKPKNSFEVIVVDNGSKDGSLESLSKLSQKYNNYHLVKNKENLGFAKANNIGIKRSRGKFVLLLNSDTEVTRGAIDKLIDFTEKFGNVGMVAPQLLNKDGSTQESIYKLPTLWRTLKHYWLGKKELDKYAIEYESEVEAVVAAAILITPKVLEKVGGLNEKYFMYFEDLDYCRAVRKAGLKVFYYPEAKIYHHHGESGKNLAEERKQWYRLLNGSRIYHGRLKFYIIYFIQRSADVFRRRILGLKGF